jgi:2-hydroxycyclohexanecarboxyl-CoA dehydrogenase
VESRRQFSDPPLETSRSPMGRAGRPENIAAACAFLASDDTDYITAHTLSVNGGRYSN